MRATVATATSALCLLYLWSLPYGCSATTYYVSSTMGNDSNAGTSASAPWMTLRRASIATYAPGDALLLSRNASWFDDVLVVSGVSNFVVGAYPSTPLPRPVVNVARSNMQRSTCVKVVAVGNNVTVQDLAVGGCGTGIEVLADGGASVAGITIQRNFLRDIRDPFGVYHAASPAWGTAVVVGTVGGQAAANITAVAVAHNVGVRLDTFWKASSPVDGLDLNSNTVAQCGGNCVALTTGANLRLRNSVFLRDTPARFFLYGTTDVILGNPTGDNSIMDTDFTRRGEYSGGPDGCAVDFEVGSHGFRITGCTFDHSYGSGIMVFGHATTSTGWTIADNVFVDAGCVQPRSDQHAVAFMCPNDQKPQGTVANNTVATSCPPPFYVNPAVAGCVDGVTFAGNDYNASVLPPPVVNLPPTSTKSPTGTATLLASVPGFPNATVRYTTDGSRPTEASPVLPAAGLAYPWPSPGIAFNVRAFQTGLTPSSTNGMVVEGGDYLGLPGGPTSGGGVHGGMGGSLDSASATNVSGWVVDTSLPGGGVPPVIVQVVVDSQVVVAGVARTARPDLPKAGVAPNADHGFSLQLPPDVTAVLATGSHVVDVQGVGSPASTLPWALPRSPVCFHDGKPAAC